MMVQRHMHEFGTTVEQMAMVSVKNHANALYNPYAQKAKRLTIKQVRESPMVATPLTMEDICTMSDGAAVCILASEEVADRKSTRLNSSHTVISYAVFCLKKKNKNI